MAQIRPYEAQQAQESQQRPDNDQSGRRGGQQPGEENDDEQGTPPPFSSEISRLCTAVTDRYRAGEFSKSAAILLIHGILCREGADPEADAFVAAFSSFVAILDGFERFRTNAAARGGGVPDGDDDGTQPGNGEPGVAHDPDVSDDGDPEPAPSTKRPRSPFSDDDQSSSRRRIDVSALPWVTQEEETPSVLAPGLRKTQLALENFAKDLKLAKASLTNSPRCPQFPDTEWTSLLSGKAVDFDRVLSGLYSVSFDDQRRERLGHLEIVAGPSAPARVVRTHSEWVIACDSAWEATVYVFPHRSAELAAYGNSTELFDFGWLSDGTSFSLTTPPSPISPCSGSRTPEPLETAILSLDAPPRAAEERLAGAGTTGSVPTETTTAPTPISAPDVGILGMSPATVLQPASPLGGRLESNFSSVETLLHCRPSYARDLIWAEDTDKEEQDVVEYTLAFASTIMPPLSPVPINEFSNITACTTICNYPHLFRVSTPINISVFRDLLCTHPNQPFVDSVCSGLNLGFWPRAVTIGVNLPETYGDVYPLRNETLYTDASGVGMGFWSPSRNMGFHSAINERDQCDKTKGIFYFEALAVTSALLWAAQLQPAPRRVVIFTDSLNTVDIFDSLRASPRYNPFLITAVDLLIRFRVQLSVRHIPGEENGVADALSRHKFDVARELSPGLTLLPFTPPRLTLGATQI
ncbi:hypothetical protein D9615_005677 [Tricholomella constricta]|uniref:RNase H type-1 domain-containing protein n=2 Tax=Tricholomella constricta TaxID=117010 RepID=A0A8H5M3U9_9AGAR|nr:hypothetical protein D9615_005677 [Tricholomella constricta]